MTLFAQQKGNSPFNPITLVMGLFVLVMIMIGLFYLAKGVFWILSWLAPVFLILTLIINHKIVVDYGKMLWRQLKTNILFGIVLTLLTILGFPVVTAYLFGKALLFKKVEKIHEEMEVREKGEWIDFEELESNVKEKKQIIEKNETNDYTELFEE